LLPSGISKVRIHNAENVYAYRNDPDVRLSLGLSEKEKEFRKKRIPFVYEKMKEIFGNDEQPKSVLEV